MPENIVSRFEVLNAMERRGGSFARQLAKLYWAADITNKTLIADTWSAMFNEYAAYALADKQAAQKKGGE